jgi:tetratricopeptide (TPR) repeat protein
MLLQLQDKIGRLRRDDSNGPEAKAALANALEQLANVQLSLGQLPEAKRSLLEAVDLVQAGAIPDERSAQAQLADLQMNLGYLFCSLEEPVSAIAHFQKAVRHFEEGSDTQRGLAATLNGLASAHGMLQNHGEAIDCLRKAAAIMEAIATASRNSADAAQWASLLNNLGRVQLAAQDVPSAMAVMERCAEITQELMRVSQGPEQRNLHAAVTCRLGSAYEAAGKAAEAKACYRRSVEDMRHLVEDLGMRQFANDYAYAVECLKRLETGEAS